MYKLKEDNLLEADGGRARYFVYLLENPIFLLRRKSYVRPCLNFCKEFSVYEEKYHENLGYDVS